MFNIKKKNTSRYYTIEAVLVTVMENNLEDDMEDDERLCGRQLQS